MKMKKALALFATVAMLLTAFSGLTLTASAATLTTQTLTMAQMEGYYKTQGRVERRGAVLCMDNAADGVEFYFYGSGDVTATIAMTSGGGSAYFSAIADGVEKRVVATGKVNDYTQNINVPLATGLTEGYHHIEFYKQNEASKSRVHIQSMTLTGNLLAAPAEDQLIMEVVGDSISGGSDVYITAEEYKNGYTGYDKYQNALESYGYKAAQLIGAESRIVQASGYGLVANWEGDATKNVPKLYPYFDYFRYNPTVAGYTTDRLFSFEPSADIVVINLGTNDALIKKDDKEAPVDGDVFAQAAYDFSYEVRTCNPGAKIVWCTGMRDSYYKAEMLETVAALGGEANGYYFCELPQGASAGTHPNAEQHTAAAQALAAFLKANCLPEDYATQATPAQLQAKIDEAKAMPTSLALTAAIETAEVEMVVGMGDAFRRGSCVEMLEEAMKGQSTDISLMPHRKNSTYDMEENGGYNHVVVPTYNADGTVFLTKEGSSGYWPRVDTHMHVAWNVKTTPYLRVETQGEANWNAEIHYFDKDGTERNVQIDDVGNGGADYQATSTRTVVTVDMGSAVREAGYADDNGVVYITYVRFYVAGIEGVYLTLYDCSLTENNGTSWAGASDAASYNAAANMVYVHENGANISGAIPNSAKVFVKSGVDTFTLDNVTMSGATTAFTVTSDVKVKLVGTNTVTASTQFSGGTPTYIGTGVLMNDNTVVMRKGDVVKDEKNRVDSSDIRAMMHHCAGISSMTLEQIRIADTEGDSAINTRDVRRFLDMVVA